MAPGRWQRHDAAVLWFAGALQESGNWDSYWNVTLSSSEFSISCTSKQDELFTVTIDALSLVGGDGYGGDGAPLRVHVLDNFSYAPQLPTDPWGKDSSWTNDTSGDSDNAVALRVACHPHKTTTVTRPAPDAAAGVAPLDMEFDAHAFTHLRYAFKLSEKFVVNDTIRRRL